MKADQQITGCKVSDGRSLQGPSREIHTDTEMKISDNGRPTKGKSQEI